MKLFHLYRDSLKAFLRKSNCVACITGVPFNRVCQLNIEASILFESNNSPWKTLLISMERHQKCSLNISVLNVSNEKMFDNVNRCIKDYLTCSPILLIFSLKVFAIRNTEKTLTSLTYLKYHQKLEFVSGLENTKMYVKCQMLTCCQ